MTILVQFVYSQMDLVVNRNVRSKRRVTGVTDGVTFLAWLENYSVQGCYVITLISGMSMHVVLLQEVRQTFERLHLLITYLFNVTA